VNWGACFWGELGKQTFLWGELRGMLLRGTMETDVSFRWTEVLASVRGTIWTDFPLRWTEGHAFEGNEGNWRFFAVNWGACFSEANEWNWLFFEVVGEAYFCKGRRETDVYLRLTDGHASEGNEGNWGFFEVSWGACFCEGS